MAPGHSGLSEGVASRVALGDDGIRDAVLVDVNEELLLDEAVTDGVLDVLRRLRANVTVGLTCVELDMLSPWEKDNVLVGLRRRELDALSCCDKDNVVEDICESLGVLVIVNFVTDGRKVCEVVVFHECVDDLAGVSDNTVMDIDTDGVRLPRDVGDEDFVGLLTDVLAESEADCTELIEWVTDFFRVTDFTCVPDTSSGTEGLSEAVGGGDNDVVLESTALNVLDNVTLG